MQSVYQDVQNMSKLTQTLLAFAKASGDKGGLKIDLIRMDEIILRIPAEVTKLNPQYVVQLAFEDLPEEEERPLVFGNETLLPTAIKNIVVNACKYSPDHRAEVKLKAAANELQVQISDTGPGIPEDKFASIFQPFYRLDENSNTEGFGLGLSLADRVIKLHKGSIKVSSKDGLGTSFVVSLPLADSLKGKQF